MTYNTKVKDRPHNLVETARHLFQIIESEADKRRLRQLAAVTLALKPLLDELPAYPDLGLELHEYVLLKSDGAKVAERFHDSLEQMLGR